MTAHEFFEAAREASRDAERCNRQLASLESRMLALGGGGFEPRVRSTPDPQRMQVRANAYVDMEAALTRRREEDYALIDSACRVLYGTDSDAGLWALVGWRADLLAQHYLNDRTWAEVGAIMGYSASHCQQQAQVALEVADGWGMVNVIAGMGAAEDAITSLNSVPDCD